MFSIRGSVGLSTLRRLLEIYRKIRLMANNCFDFVKSFELVAVTVLIGTFRFEDVGDYEDEI